MMATAGILLAVCATKQQRVQGRENMLAAAGFSIRPADTPERRAELKSLTPHEFTCQQRDGQLVYVYSDPAVCDCMYIGSEQAYQKYPQSAFRKQIADQQTQAAQMGMDNWNRGAWEWRPG